MDKLVKRINIAIENSEKICVYGDYDVDGITATVLVYSYLKSRGANVVYYIPKRDKEGYGLNKNTINQLKIDDVNLIFTVDNGISAFSEIEHANSIGIDVIVTDHHRIHEKIPNAVAVVNPHRDDCNITYKNLAGVGVAFKAIQSIEGQASDLYELFDKYSDLVALGTIGDSIELSGETRDIVKIGIENIINPRREGVKAIIKYCRFTHKQLDPSSIAFGIIPRINASGRMADAELAVRFLLCEDREGAIDIAKELDDLNTLRKKTEIEILEIVENQLQNEPHRKFEKIIIAEGEGWHHGVLGIAASRISTKYGKPCVLISIDGEDARGSCRSIDGFSIHQAISSCAEYLDRFGGHPMAAGINLKTENISAFKKAILEYADSFESMPYPTLSIDCKLNPKAISQEILDCIDSLKPFGMGNREPLFGIFNMTLRKIKSLSNNKHLKLIFERDGHRIETVYFGKSADDFLYNTGEVLDLAVTLHRNEYMGFKSVAIWIMDIRLSNTNTISALAQKRIYENFKLGNKLTAENIKILKPYRNDFIHIYKYLQKNKIKTCRADVLSQRIFQTNKYTGKIYIIFDALNELNLLNITKNAEDYRIKINESSIKVNLDNSGILKILSAMEGEVNHDGPQ